MNECMKTNEGKLNWVVCKLYVKKFPDLPCPPFCPPFSLLHAVVVVVVKEEDEEAIIIIIIIQIENVCLSNSLSNSLSNNNNNIYTIPERDNDEEERGERKTRECFDLFCFFSVKPILSLLSSSSS